MWRKGVVLSATFLFGIFLIVACKKKAHTLGQNTIDQNALLHSDAIDTFSLITYSYFDDSVVSDNAPFGILGSYVDPVFGKFNSEIYTQFRLAGLNPDFGDVNTITVDSFVLALEYIGYYGEVGDQTVRVYELTEDMHIDSTYYSFNTINSNTSIDWVVPGTEVKKMNPAGITVVGSDTVDTQLRIQLDPAKAQSMINVADAGTGEFVDNEAFLNYFKGLRILTDNPGQMAGDGGVFYFNMNDPASKLTIYYTQDTVQKTFDLLINSSCADFNHVDIDNSGTKVEAVLNDSLKGMEEFYAQSFGSRAVVRIPGLDNIPPKSVIHKAILDLPVSYKTGSPYSPGLDLSVSTILSEGSTKLYSVNTVGEYSNFSKSVTVDLRNYVQAIVNGELENTQLVFSPILHSTSADRIIFNGTATSNKTKPKFYILYTEF